MKVLKYEILDVLFIDTVGGESGVLEWDIRLYSPQIYDAKVLNFDLDNHEEFRTHCDVMVKDAENGYLYATTEQRELVLRVLEDALTSADLQEKLKYLDKTLEQELS